MSFNSITNITIGVHGGGGYNITSACIKHAFDPLMKAECARRGRAYPSLFSSILLYPVCVIAVNQERLMITGYVNYFLGNGHRRYKWLTTRKQQQNTHA